MPDTVDRLRADVYAEVFDGLVACSSSRESVNAQAARRTDNIMKHVAYHASRWIPVSERLPEDGKRVVVYGPACRERDIGYHYKRRWVVGFAGSCLESRITHWMPLPEPPADVAEQT